MGDKILLALTTIITNTGFFAAIVWGIQKIINNSAERKLADYKGIIDTQLLSYKSIYDKQIEEYKSQLKFLNDRLSTLHVKRSEIIETIHKKLVEIRVTAAKFQMLPNLQDYHPTTNYDKLDDLAQEFDKMSFEFTEIYVNNSIYFNENVSTMLEEIRQTIYRFSIAALNLSNTYLKELPTDIELGKELENYKNAYKNFNDNIGPAINELAKEFRMMLGVDDANQ